VAENKELKGDVHELEVKITKADAAAGLLKQEFGEKAKKVDTEWKRKMEALQYENDDKISKLVDDVENLTKQVSERSESERALRKKRAIDLAKRLQTATYTTKLTVFSIRLVRLVRWCFIKNAPRFARRSLRTRRARTASPTARAGSRAE
tara:strand:- start:71 stop:520 length:450 start_codon:yes stop_codon:yes gene_type:complete